MLRGRSERRPLRHPGRGVFLVIIILLAMGGDRWLLLPSLPGEETAEAAVTIEMITDPPREQTLPDTRPAQLTFKASVKGEPLGAGRLAVEVTAPPPPMLLPTPIPAVEGTTLLQLSSDLAGGTFAIEYLFPIHGVYTFDFDITPGADGQALPSEKIRHNLHVQAEPAGVRRAWLFRIALFSLGGIAGAWYACAAHRQKRPSSPAVIAPGVLVLGGLVFITGSFTFADHGPRELTFPKGTQVVHGDDGWALEVRPTPERAVVGELLDLTVTLTHEGQVFAGAMDVAMHVYNLKDDQTVLRTNIVAPHGSTSQRFQLFESVPHTCTITARPASGTSGAPAPLTAVVGIDGVAAPLPISVRLRVMGLVLGMVCAGAIGGFWLASGVRKLPRRSA